MARGPATKPRKTAVQQRSRVTVGALVEATARILVREGFDKASTNRIAEVAGVSVGSLYQYFPSKEALVAAVIERHQQAIGRAILDELAAVWALPVDQAVRGLVALAVKGHLVDPALHHVLAEQIPRVGMLAEIQARADDLAALFRAYLESRRAELRVDDLRLASFICVTAIEALTHNAVLHHRELLSDEAMGAFIDESARLVIGYLKS
jgi:AcrR family transcriptional regulator